MTLRGIDISNWQGEISPAIAACLASQIDVAVVRASLESMDLVGRAQRQMQALKDAGMDVHGYIWLYPSWDPVKTASDALREYGSLDLPWYWIDAEEDTDIGSPERNALCLRDMIATLEAAGRKVGIYTGRWWWDQPRHMNGSHGFAGVPLWVADYNGTPDITQWTRFGGWTEAWGKQYRSDGNLCGITPLDLDTFSDAVRSTPEPVPPVDPHIEQIAQLKAALSITASAVDALALELQNATTHARSYAQGARDALAKWG